MDVGIPPAIGLILFTRFARLFPPLDDTGFCKFIFPECPIGLSDILFRFRPVIGRRPSEAETGECRGSGVVLCVSSCVSLVCCVDATLLSPAVLTCPLPPPPLLACVTWLALLTLFMDILDARDV